MNCTHPIHLNYLLVLLGFVPLKGEREQPDVFPLYILQHMYINDYNNRVQQEYVITRFYNQTESPGQPTLQM